MHFKQGFIVGLFIFISNGNAAAIDELKLDNVTLSVEQLNCNEKGTNRLVIVGEVILQHTSKEQPFLPLDPEREISIYCDDVHFEKGSILKSPTNIRLVVGNILSGEVNIESTRGITGYDAPSIKIPDLSKHKAADGREGNPGNNGRNASDTDGDGSRGETGREGEPGKTGNTGENGGPGSTGADASHIHVTAKMVADDATVRLSARGGNGGAGGRGGRGESGGIGGQGGRGGKGGDSSFLHDAEKGGDGGNGGVGGTGGNGGKGGSGGNGGRGGDVYFYIAQDGGRLSEVGTYLVDGGQGGFPGIGGAPGLGGDGGQRGHPGGGGRSKSFDPADIFTLGIHRIVLDDGTEFEWHGEGDWGNHGEFGAKGKNGRAGPIGTWGKPGEKGKSGEPFLGIVSLDDFNKYKTEIGF